MRRFLAMAMGLCVVSVSLVTVGTNSVAVGSPAPIVVGGDGDLAIAAGVAQGFEAGLERFNKSGGLDGRKIKFLGVLDDGFSAQTNLTNAAEAGRERPRDGGGPHDQRDCGLRHRHIPGPEPHPVHRVGGQCSVRRGTPVGLRNRRASDKPGHPGPGVEEEPL